MLVLDTADINKYITYFLICYKYLCVNITIFMLHNTITSGNTIFNFILGCVAVGAQRPKVIKLSCGWSVGASVCPVHCGKDD